MFDKAPKTTMSWQTDAISLFIALSDNEVNNTSYLCEDDGLTFNRNKGEYLDTKFTVKEKNGKTCISASVTGKNFQKFKRDKFLLKIAGSKKIAVKVDGNKVKPGKHYYRISNSGESFEVEVSS